MNGVDAGLGSTGVGTGAEVMRDGKPLLGASTVAVVGVGRLNLNPSPLIAEAGAGAGAAGAPKVGPVVLGAPIAPIGGKSNSFVSAGLDLSSLFGGGNDRLPMEGIFLDGRAAEAGADSFIGDELFISSSREGGVLVCSRATFVGVACGLGAAVGAVNTIVGAMAERVIGALWDLNSGAGLA